MTSVTVLIPHIPPRMAQLSRALKSVFTQTLYPDAVIVEVDHHHLGSALTRNRGLTKVSTEWVAFLDDDDELLPHHLDELVRCAQAKEADVVYPGCIVQGGHDPHDRFGQPFNPELLRQKSYIPVTSLVRTELAQSLPLGFHRAHGTDYDDWGFYLQLLDTGATFIHHPVKTWIWHHWGHGTSESPGNTSGMGDRWR